MNAKINVQIPYILEYLDHLGGYQLSKKNVYVRVICLFRFPLVSYTETDEAPPMLFVQ
jgi:hypothetical protein